MNLKMHPGYSAPILNGEVVSERSRKVLWLEVPMQAGSTSLIVLTLPTRVQGVEACSSPNASPLPSVGYSYNLKENPYDYYHIHHNINSSFRIVIVFHMGRL